jgi:hypothetical protein
MKTSEERRVIMKRIDSWREEGFSTRKSIVFWLTLAAMLFVFSGTTKADLTEMAKIVAGDGAYSDLFGSSVSIDGDYVIVGAPNDDEGVLINTGCAYIFQRSGSAWIQRAKLVAPDRVHNDTFGASVSISGDYAIVGKPFDDSTVSPNSGSAYIFKRNGSDWGQQVIKLKASDPGANDYFGNAVAISGDYAVVGAPMDDAAGVDSGSAYIFRRNVDAWEQIIKLVPAQLATGDHFGYAVEIDEGNVVVGAPLHDNENGTDAGCIYFFKRSGDSWTEFPAVAHIDSDGAADDQFGWSVSINGQFAIAGGPYHDGNTLNNSGTARIFEDAWGLNLWRTLDLHLLAPLDSAASNDQFGFSVSISSDIAVVGSLKYLNGNGSVCVFRKNTNDDGWPQFEKLVASDGPWGFGAAVAVSGRYAAVGAKWDINSAGSVYVYDLSSEPPAPPPTGPSGFSPAIPLLLLEE